MQPKSQISSGYLAHKASAPGSQQLSLMSSTTLLRPCCPNVSSAQVIHRIRPQHPRASTAQFEKLNSSTQALNSDHADKKSIQIEQNDVKITSRSERSKLKNEYSLRKRLHMSWVPILAKKEKKRKKKRKKKASKDINGTSDIRGRSKRRRRGACLSGSIWFSRIVC